MLTTKKLCTYKDAWTQYEVQPGSQRTVKLQTSLSLMKLHQANVCFCDLASNLFYFFINFFNKTVM